MHDPLDPCAVNSLIETPGCDPVVGRVVWDPIHSLWNGSMLVVALIAGPLTISPAAIAVFVLTTGATLLLGHSIGFHRRHDPRQLPVSAVAGVWACLDGDSRGHERTVLDDPRPRPARLGPAAA
jgi:hypothetical protein